MNNRPKLHVSIHYDGNSKLKTNLKKQLSVYSVRLLSNPWEPSVNICLDTFNTQAEKQVQQELLYDAVLTYRTKQSLTTAKELYTIVILLVSLSRQRLYEINPNSRDEDWLLISITPSSADDQSNNDFYIQWSLGNNLIIG